MTPLLSLRKIGCGQKIIGNRAVVNQHVIHAVNKERPSGPLGPIRLRFEARHRRICLYNTRGAIFEVVILNEVFRGRAVFSEVDSTEIGRRCEEIDHKLNHVVNAQKTGDKMQ